MFLDKAFFIALCLSPAHGQAWIQAPAAGEEAPASAPAETSSPAQEAAEETPSYLSKEAVLPSYLSLRPNLNDFTAFADGGWDGNWYVGYNNCWIVQLPSAPPGRYVRAYIGAKLGRAKTQPKPGHGLERVPIPGKIYMAISSTQAFSAAQSYLLALTQELAVEPDPNLINQDTKKAGWYWTEVPLKLVNFLGPNYLAIYSPTDYLQSASSAPILGAAATHESGARAWLNRSVRGTAPSDPAAALETPINYLLPAMALKLVPPGGTEIVVRGLTAERSASSVRVSFSAAGENIDAAWVEISLDNLDWDRLGPSLRQPPFIFTLPTDALPKGELYVRGAARDILGNSASSAGVPLSSAP